MSEQTLFQAPGFLGNVVGSLGEMLVIDARVQGDIPAHAAESEEFAVVLSGRFEANVDGAVSVCGAGDYMIIQKGCVHSIRALEPGRLILIGKV